MKTFVESESGLIPSVPLTPSLSPSGGEGARRAGEGENQRLKAQCVILEKNENAS